MSSGTCVRHSPRSCSTTTIPPPRRLRGPRWWRRRHVSPSAQRKALTKLTTDHTPEHSFQTLLSDLATLARNRILPNTKDPVAFDLVTTPTPLQQRAFDLLGVNYRM
jgi:hypothetical protein